MDSSAGNNQYEKKVCIIGFGVSGIAACRWALHYGFTPIVYDINESFGGIWLTHNYPGCKLQTNRWSYCFSDEPMPSSYPLYPTGQNVYDYLSSYVSKHNLLQYVQFNTEVLSISQQTDKIWHIISKRDNTVNLYKTPYVIIAGGFYGNKKERIKDSFIPSDFSRNRINVVEFFKNKSVAVVGIGPSGCDLACTAVQNNASNVSILYRSSRWIFTRYLWGYSLHFFTWRIFLLLGNIFPRSIFRIMLMILYMIPIFSLERGQIEFPLEKACRKNITLNDHIYTYKAQGKLKIIKDPETLKTLNFEKYKPDIIIDATGYPSGISLLGYNDEIPKLYKNIIVPGINTLGCIGYVASFNWIQTSDLQARWLFNVFLDKIDLPTKIEQYQWISTVRREDYHDLAYEIYDYCEMLYKNMPYKKHITSWRDWITTPEHDRWV